MVGLTADDLAEARRLWAYQQGSGLPVTPLRRQRAARPRTGARPAGARRRVRARRPPGRPARCWCRRCARPRSGPARCSCRGRSGTLSEVDARRSPWSPPAAARAALHRPAGAAGEGPDPAAARARRRAPGFRHVIRGYADGRHVYLVPRADGEVVVGATVEERGRRPRHRRAACSDLLRAAVDLVPELAEHELVERVAGLRPGTPDNAPIARAAARPTGRAGRHRAPPARRRCSPRSPPT